MLSLLATSDFNPVSEFTDFINHPYVELPLGLDINKGVVYLWLSAATAILVPLLIIRKGLKAKPSRRQTFLEIVYDTAYTQIAKAGLPEEGMRIWFPYVATCFVFIWAMNVIGFIPLPFGERQRAAARARRAQAPDLRRLRQPVGGADADPGHLLRHPHRGHPLQRRRSSYFKSWMPSGLPPPRPLRAGSVGARSCSA